MPKGQEHIAASRQLDWKSVASSFHILSGNDLLAMKVMARHQVIRDNVAWLKEEDQPLALLFISHRWETLDHPDPQGRHLRALQDIMRRICLSVQAMFVPRKERLKLVPSLTFEGALQTEEIARRILGYGPFSGGPACVKGTDAKRMIIDRFNAFGNDRMAFRNWLACRIGVWLDYVCMPQKPLSCEEGPEFRTTLAMLDSLVMSCTLVALRDGGDDYATRGWCASEFFLASAHSFARNLSVDIKRLEHAEEVAISRSPVSGSGSTSDVAKVMTDSYEHDLLAYRKACDQWSSFEGPLIDAAPSASWAAYRDLQGSSFFTAEFDPNPSRVVLEAIRGMETVLIEKWFMSDKQHLFDLGKETRSFLQGPGLHCAQPSDLIYLGFLLACHGWIDALRPLFRECLRWYLETVMVMSSGNADDSAPVLLVILKPLAQPVRALFSELKPSSAGTWNFRLSKGLEPDPRERLVVEQVLNSLMSNPPEFEFVESHDRRLLKYAVERLA